MHEPFRKNELRIAVLGGGTGSFALLSDLKNHTSQLAAIVNMVDDGGSTGVLRDELGTLPPGDVRQCLVALSSYPKIRDLFNYRFDKGTFGGHSFGNLLLTALEKVTGNFNDAVETASEILRIKGKVIPATLDNVRLKMEWSDASLTLNGERVIDEEFFKNDPRRAKLSLHPTAIADPMAIAAIEQADLVVIAPGDLYTSLGPLLVIDGIARALKTTKAKRVYVANLVTKKGQTSGFTVSDHASEIERFVGAPFLDYVLYNKQRPSKDIEHLYKAEKAFLVKEDVKKLTSSHYVAVAGDFLGSMATRRSADTLISPRSLIRHDAAAISKSLMEISRRQTGF